MEPDPTIAALRDRAEIQELQSRYARGIDSRDFAKITSCFSADAELDYGAFLVQGDVEETFRVILNALARYVLTQHVMGTQSIELLGDAAHLETYAVAYHHLADAGRPSIRVSGIRYEDDLRRQDGQWQIHRRKLHYLWQSELPALPLPGNG